MGARMFDRMMERARDMMEETKIVDTMIVYDDGPTKQHDTFIRGEQEQLWVVCRICAEPQLIEIRYPEGQRPVMVELPICMSCQGDGLKEKEVDKIAAEHIQQIEVLIAQKEKELAEKIEEVNAREATEKYIAKLERREEMSYDEIETQTRGQVTHQINQLEKNVAFLLECSSELHSRLAPVLGLQKAEEGLAKESVELCLMASAIEDQNTKLENLGSALTHLLHNLEL